MKKKRKKSFIKLINVHKFQLKQKIFAFFIIFILIISVYIRYLVTPIVVENTRAQVANFATKSINYAIADTMNQNVSYGDLIKIIRDEKDNVSYIEANSVRINLLSKTMSKVVMSNFLELSKSPIKIPLGSFSGVSIFAGLGPKFTYDINPYGEVFCYFTSNFETAGINQTYHKLYLIIKLKVNVVLPLKNVLVNSESEVLLCETLIVGKIPEVYLNSNNLTEMLNLVPEKFSS
ncbi:MAG: sporulation protein YunB [Clostridia bacterium]|nr:sporulation protein YunB [Clostridia bacterium]